MKILITGANGLLGQKLITQLVDHVGVDIIATGRGANRNPTGGYKYCSLNITDKKQVATVIARESPDVVINCAAMTHVDQCEQDRENCWDQNVNAVKYLISSCDQVGAFLIHLSTDFIFDGEHGPYLEDAEPNPLSYYGESKLASEKLLMESEIDWAIVRTVLVFGVAHDKSKSNIVLWVKSSIESGKNIQVVNDQWRMPTLAEDLATGCIAIALKKIQGVFNISGKDMLTPYDMAIQTAEFFKLDKSLIEEVDGSVFTQPAVRPVRTGFILDKAKTVWGYQPHNFSEGLSILQKQLTQRKDTA
jgi:dTDP-4-dehydrorhamnose reductase